MKRLSLCMLFVGLTAVLGCEPKKAPPKADMPVVETPADKMDETKPTEDKMDEKMDEKESK